MLALAETFSQKSKQSVFFLFMNYILYDCDDGKHNGQDCYCFYPTPVVYEVCQACKNQRQCTRAKYDCCFVDGGTPDKKPAKTDGKCYANQKYVYHKKRCSWRMKVLEKYDDCV